MPDHNDVLTRLKAGKSASVRAMAEVIGCHPNTLWKAIRDGEVKAVRIGRIVSIPSPEGLRLVGLDTQAAA